MNESVSEKLEKTILKSNLYRDWMDKAFEVSENDEKVRNEIIEYAMKQAKSMSLEDKINLLFANELATDLYKTYLTEKWKSYQKIWDETLSKEI